MQKDRADLLLNMGDWALRVAIGLSLLSAVADRFGFWGPPGASNVSWGKWANFVDYSAKVNSFLPYSWNAFLARAATALEAFFGLALLAGLRWRVVTYGSAVLFLAFAAAMTISFGVKAPLNFSVFCDAAGSFFLAVRTTPPGRARPER